MKRFTWVLGAIGGLLVLVFLTSRFLLGAVETPWAIVGGVGSVMLIAWLWLDKDNVEEVATSRATVYTSGALVLTVLALGVAVAANVLGQRYDTRWDWTQSGRYTLSEQSISAASALTEPVQVVGFFQTGSIEESAFKGLIDSYKGHTDKLQLQLYDPVQEPLMTQQFAVTNPYGTVVLVQGDAQQRMESEFGEEPFTNALVRLGSDTDHIVCFTTGHGERAVDDDGAQGVSAVVIKAEGQNYTIKTVQPLRDGLIDPTCEVVVAASPRVDLLAPEREILADWVGQGKALLVLLDPFDTPPAFVQDLARYGFAIGDDVLLEDNPNYQLQGGDPSYIVLDAKSYDFHPITAPLQAISVLRLVRSVDILEMEGIQAQVLATSSDRSWAEENLLDGSAPEPGPDERVGNVPLIAVSEILDPAVLTVGATALPRSELPSGEGAPEDPEAEPAVPEPAAPSDEEAAEAPAPTSERVAGGRVVVFGDSDFITNELILQGENQDLFLNTIAWLVGEEDQISIRTNDAAGGTLDMTELQYAFVILLALLFVPGLCVFAAAFTWFRRRRL